MTPEEKAERARARMIGKAREKQIGTYVRDFVAPVFQQMVRAEAAAEPFDTTPAIVDGIVLRLVRRRGECVCVTCGKVARWSGGLGGMHTGHFLASRRYSILFEEDNVAPQCSHCNRFDGSAPVRFRQWMVAIRGPDTIARLERLKTTTRSFSREELVDMKIAYEARLKAAEERIDSA